MDRKERKLVEQRVVRKVKALKLGGTVLGIPWNEKFQPGENFIENLRTVLMEFPEADRPLAILALPDDFKVLGAQGIRDLMVVLQGALLSMDPPKVGSIEEPKLDDAAIKDERP